MYHFRDKESLAEQEPTNSAGNQRLSRLSKKGLPQLASVNDQLIKLESYNEKLYTITTDKAQFAQIKGHITGKEFLEALEPDLMIRHDIKNLFLVKPTFEKYTEVDEVYRRMVNLEIPFDDKWDQLCEIIG